MSQGYGRLEEDPPNEFICPISQSIMIDPGEILRRIRKALDEAVCI